MLYALAVGVRLFVKIDTIDTSTRANYLPLNDDDAI